jgi:DNA-3-methyladenine glycosylase II
MSTLTRQKSFILEPLGPFSLREAARFWGGFAPAAHAGMDAEGHLHMAFPVEGSWTTAGVCVREVDAAINGEVYGDADPEIVKRQTARILSLNVDGRGYAEVGVRDPVAGKLQCQYPGLRPVCFYSPYEAAVWAIISHRIQLAQAAVVKTRMAERLGETISIHGQPMRAFPGPQLLQTLDAFPGLFGRKPANLQAIARAALAGELEAAYLRWLRDEDALARLEELPGIGPFSSQLILLRGAGHPDFLTLEEPRFRHAVREAYGFDHEPTNEDLRRVSEAWRPYRMWITFLLRQTSRR